MTFIAHRRSSDSSKQTSIVSPRHLAATVARSLAATVARPLAATMASALVLSFASLVSPTAAYGYSPEDATVIQMVDRGIKFLETASTGTNGEKVICAYAHFKVEHDESNPVVAAGIRAAKEFAAALDRGQQYKSNYECAVSIMLLADISPTRYRSELAAFQRYFNEAQMPHGGYGYPGEREGDVSQTQYAVLAIWVLDRAGFPLDYARVVKCLQWLSVVQDRKGPWPYHGVVPANGVLTDQKEISMSMALAGAASLLIGGDALRLWGDTVPEDDTGIVGLPKAVKIYKEDANVERRKKATLPKEPLLRACERMEQWRAANPETFGGNLYWYFYTAYTTERYESFVEIANGLPADKSPGWYNKIVAELIKMQSAETGGWEARAHTNAAVSTAFAILFLIRSTQKALGAEYGATTIGGQGFKGDVSKAKLKNGMAVTEAPAQSVNEMLQLLESDGADELDGKALADQAKLPDNPVERSAQLDRLERLVRGSQSWQARRVSAKLLGTSDDLRVVPALIFALSDPDHVVRQYARDGLRFISRKFEGFGMPDDPTNAELREAQRAWRAWYLTMKPGYVFLDEI